MRIYPLRQLANHLPVDHRIHIAPQHHQHPPIPQLDFPAQRLAHLDGDGAMSGVEQTGSESRHRHDEDPVQDHDGEHASQDHEPEPDEDVGFFVDDVEREDAQAVVLLDGPGGTVFVEDALGDPREHVHHGVHAVLLGLLGEVHHAPTVGEELAVEEAVH